MGKRRAMRRGAHRSEPEDAGALRRVSGFLGSTVPRRVEPPRLLNVLIISGVLLGLLLFGYSTTQIYLQFGSDPGASENPGATEDLEPESPPGSSSAEQDPGNSGGPRTQAGTEPTTVVYRVVDRGAAGFTGSVTLTNTSDSRLEAWELALAFDDAEVTEVHDADWEPLEDGILARQPGNGDGLDPGESATISFDAMGDPEDPPARCSLNGHVCNL
ncbi:cellulose binding domain-containing protein [Nocardiopsis xinjiangensis]|uniref:cellulose binding domain-containing protein n=1 Tax=Nocardiopsis xinjiangensis TaxID=124285 RepID=UPI000477AD24|nr:cellulose binding domain-containing protein [Nocardiopsis xinjiangensis]